MPSAANTGSTEPSLSARDTPANTIRITYTELAHLEPPQQGDIVALNGFGRDARFRVTNEPEAGEDGSFSIDIEPA